MGPHFYLDLGVAVDLKVIDVEFVRAAGDGGRVGCRTLLVPFVDHSLTVDRKPPTVVGSQFYRVASGG